MQGRGFTLIELLVTLSIFAILSAIVVPIYTQYAQRGYRTEVMSELMVCAQALERFSAVNFTYEGANPDGDGTPLGKQFCDPVSVRQGRYVITAVTTSSTYELTAAPAGAMRGDGVITLDQAGRRTWDENDDGVETEDEDWEES